MNNLTDISGIVAKLMTARQAYYIDGEPVMSDREFDGLETHLNSLDPGNAYFSTVGIPSLEGGKIHHRVPMLSMNKVKSIQDMKDWLHRLRSLELLPEDGALTVQPKVDGLSATALYRNGRLQYVATRGDGTVGQDVSHIALPMRSTFMPTVNFSPDSLEIRGELHLPKDTSYDTGGRPLRNNCVGLVNRKEHHEDLSHVRFLAYQIVPEERTSSSIPPFEGVRIDLLKKQGFYTVPFWTVNSLEEIRDIYDAYIDHHREDWNFETDGLVIVVDDTRLHGPIDEHWVVDHHHHYAVAFKAPAQSVETTLLRVDWQVSRQGVLSPVAVFEPISLGGAVLERASLHNAKNVRKLALRLGNRILVERANDVIPHVRENLDAGEQDDAQSSLFPEHCPSCGTTVLNEGVNLICPNLDCRDRVLQSLLWWVRQAGVEQVALRSLEILYDAGKLGSVKDLYTLKPEDFEGLEGFGEKKIANFLNQMDSAKTMSAVELLSNLGIPLVQKKSLTRLGIRSLEDFLNFNDDGYAIGQNILAWKAREGNLESLNRLLQVLHIQEEKEPDGKAGLICLTGKAPLPRRALTDILKERGWDVADAVTGKTTLLLCDDVAETSAKLKRAREAGVKILDYETFFAQEGMEI